MRVVRSTALALLAVTVLGPAAWAGPDGEHLFKVKCGICHSDEPGVNRVGPSLAGVVGRKASSVAGFTYSDANKASGVTWDPPTLDKYLTNPREFMPGTRMSFPGLPDAADRKAVIEYLQAH